MFYKKRIKELGNEITAMMIVNETIQMLYKSFETEIDELKKENKNIKKELNSVKNYIDEALKKEGKKLIFIDDKIVELTIENKKTREFRSSDQECIGEIGKNLTEAKEVLKELAEKLGYDILSKPNDDYMKAYKVELIKK